MNFVKREIIKLDTTCCWGDHIEIKTLKLKFTNKTKEIKIYNWIRVGKRNGLIIKNINILNKKNKDIESANELLEVTLNNRKYYKDSRKA